MLWPLLNADRSPIKALVHITGGGFFDNIPRVLPYGLGAKIERGSWPVLPVFKAIQEIGQIDLVEMYHVFNMGVGMVAVIDPEDLGSVQEKITEKIWVIGEVTSGEGVALV